LGETLDTLEVLGSLLEQMGRLPRSCLRFADHPSETKVPWPEAYGLREGQARSASGHKRWVVERTNAWHNAHKKRVCCTQREGKVIDFWVAFSEVVIIVRKLIREGWTRYRWESRSYRRPWGVTYQQGL